jgi:hypothetical protein
MPNKQIGQPVRAFRFPYWLLTSGITFQYSDTEYKKLHQNNPFGFLVDLVSKWHVPRGSQPLVGAR